MVSYNVEISPTASRQLNNYIDYLQYTLLNEQAADSVLLDAYETIEQLETSAGSLKYCDHPELKALGYKKIKFKHHDYIMIYDVKNTTVQIKAIYHLLQDYENIFMQEIDSE